MNKVVSIIVPVYNVEVYLHKCIESILAQTYINLDIILIDDGSTDDSAAICDYYAGLDSRIRVFHQCNGGLSCARNRGNVEAKGNYIAYIDSDDYIHEKYIEKLVDAIISTGSDFSMCSYKKIYSNNTLNNEMPEKNEEISVYDSKSIKELILSRQLPIYAHGKLFDAKLIPFLKFPDGRIYEDVPTIWKVLCNVKKVCYIGDELYFYRQRNNSIVNMNFTHARMDQLFFAEDIFNEIDNNEFLHSLAGSRCFFAALDNFTMATRRDEDWDYLKNAVSYYARYVLKDSYASKSYLWVSVLASKMPLLARRIGRIYKKVSWRKIKDK
ncbi:glycosyltransferase family 2 protein [Butyrivibrio sp. YAB3001]|uniref:glycosyltransferase family 2 protein n=1 Tax=Butyrivibrio sp. YAB3001 TaxID=1520812 RepID=UPI0008F67061|nr:glycosyltransferase [Butyrivibrio sp. YAB3001]SFC98362.1 Glycosyl transferase family 2 [Butyrivibrio sp. YAB3001]